MLLSDIFRLLFDDMIIDALDLSNMSHALFHTVVEKMFSSKDVWFFLYLKTFLCVTCIGSHSKLLH